LFFYGDVLIYVLKISWLFLQGVLTGKGMAFGGSNIRPEATGYGATYFAECVLKEQGQDFKVSWVWLPIFKDVTSR